MTEIKKNIQEMTYGELVSERRSVLMDIEEYEIFMNKGGHLGTEFISVPGTEKEYKENLRKLSDISAYMAKVYTSKTPMVDETDSEEMIGFARGTFWFENQEDEIDEDNAQLALEYLNRLSDEGNAEAQNVLGALYYEGRYVERNYELAAQLYIAAAKKDYSLAMSNAGYCFYYGNGVKQNYAEAFKYFSKASSLGEYDAMNMLGDMYRDGKFVQEDKNMAFQIYKDAYEKIPQMVFVDAHSENLLRLGICFMYGYGCDVDKETALQVLKDAKEVFELQIDYGRGFYAKKGLNQTNELLHELGSGKENNIAFS